MSLNASSSAVYRSSAWMRYSVALALLVGLLGVQWLLEPYFQNQFVAIFLILATLVSAWLGGFGPAALVSVAGLYAVARLFPEPPDKDDLGYTGVVFYFLITLGMALMGSGMARARRKAELAAERFQTTLSSIGDAVMVTDQHGRVVSLNPVAETLTGWSSAEAVGQPLESVFVIINERTRQPTENPAIRAMQEGVIVGLANHTLLITKDGFERPIDDSAAPIRANDGSLFGSVLVFRDVTERKAVERELQGLATELTKTDRRKDAFLATLAHELRNPLAPIRTGLEILKMSFDNPAQAEEVRSTMERQTNQLTALVDDLLDVSRIATGKLKLRVCVLKLQNVLQSAIEATRPAIDAEGHQLTVDIPQEPILLKADPHRLTQVFSNLLNNAAKYTPYGGKISIAVSLSGDQVAVSVKDSGIGIPHDKQSEIFEMFTQIEHPLQRDTSGLGMGLPLVRSLVALHGGAIEVHSDGESRGSEFVVRLPIQHEHAAQAIETAEPTPPEVSEPRRVLVADDNRAAADMLAMIVRLFGHEVRTACDGQEAIAVAAEFRPDIVLMDIGMPKLNGYEAARQMRQANWGSKVTLIAITGWGQDEDRLKSREAGFDHHLVKPVDPADLKKMLNAAERC